MKWLQNLKSVFLLKDNPECIARGFALGSFIGMMPIPGFQMILSLGIASLLKVNRRAACMAVFNTNIFTGVFFFSFNFWLGKKILGISTGFQMPDKISLDFISQILSAGFEVFISIAVGGFVTGIGISFLSYQLVKNIYKKRKS